MGHCLLGFVALRAVWPGGFIGGGLKHSSTAGLPCSGGPLSFGGKLIFAGRQV